MKHPRTLWKLGIIPPLSVFGKDPDQPTVVVNTANGAVEHKMVPTAYLQSRRSEYPSKCHLRMPSATEIVKSVKATQGCPNPASTAKKLTKLMTQAIKETLGEDHEDFFNSNSIWPQIGLVGIDMSDMPLTLKTKSPTTWQNLPSINK